MNLKEEEQKEVIDILSMKGVVKNMLPKVITNEFNQKERKQIYLGGGCFFVTTPILVVDTLNLALPKNLVSGVIVCNAHKIKGESNISFIIRLFKENNPNIFVKAFSDQEYHFTNGFETLKKILVTLFLEKLYLWPRFRKEITDCLTKHTPEVLEITTSMTPYMKEIQSNIIDLIKISLKEISKLNIIDIEDDLNFDSFTLKSFDYTIKLKLAPHWEKLGKKTKGIISDLEVLRQMLL